MSVYEKLSSVISEVMLVYISTDFRCVVKSFVNERRLSSRAEVSYSNFLANQFFENQYAELVIPRTQVVKVQQSHDFCVVSNSCYV